MKPNTKYSLSPELGLSKDSVVRISISSYVKALNRYLSIDGRESCSFGNLRWKSKTEWFFIFRFYRRWCCVSSAFCLCTSKLNEMKNSIRKYHPCFRTFLWFPMKISFLLFYWIVILRQLQYLFDLFRIMS